MVCPEDRTVHGLPGHHDVGGGRRGSLNLRNSRTAGKPELAATVVGVGRHGGRTDLPVTWNPAAAGAFDTHGVVTLHGVARVVDGGELVRS
ncbi:hypothetical protein ACFYO2_32190 [Streptomyces sp. NPDC006602]|uniref:hypothetical protein n=1 Tax=Streptomyces sp. NPDC006602 TaxID=3364751 RepID=UPI0036C2A061